MQTKKVFYYLAVLAVLFTACNDLKIKKEVFRGYAQKGPFIVGSSVTISELNANFDQTGRVYSTTISDNAGNFEQRNIELVSNYVELKVDGYFYNEVIGSAGSDGLLTLYALVDIADVTSANVNVLTHLEKPRVEYLLKQGYSFSDAKQQAQREVLAIFGFNPPENSSETLNLVDDAKLLAVSCILQGIYVVQGHLQERMASISADIKTDGILNNMALGAKLMDNAILLTSTDVYAVGEPTYMQHIRNHLETRYAEMGIDVTIPDFESYIHAFIDSNLY